MVTVKVTFDVGVQMQLNLMFAGDANRTRRHAHFAAADRAVPL